MSKYTFEQWLRRVDAWLEANTGLGRLDLPDCCYRDWYDDGMSPTVAARRAVRAAREG